MAKIKEFSKKREFQLKQKFPHNRLSSLIVVQVKLNCESILILLPFSATDDTLHVIFISCLSDSFSKRVLVHDLSYGNGFDLQDR